MAALEVLAEPYRSMATCLVEVCAYAGELQTLEVIRHETAVRSLLVVHKTMQMDSRRVKAELLKYTKLEVKYVR